MSRVIWFVVTGQHSVARLLSGLTGGSLVRNVQSRHTSEILQARFQITTIKQVIFFCLFVPQYL